MRGAGAGARVGAGASCTGDHLRADRVRHREGAVPLLAAVALGAVALVILTH
jgi:hypothetical protein